MGDRLCIFLQGNFRNLKEDKANWTQARTCNPELVTEKKNMHLKEQ